MTLKISYINTLTALIITFFAILDVLAYQNFEDREIIPFKESLAKKYKNGELTDSELAELTRTLESFKQFKIHTQNWLKAINQGTREAEKAKEFVNQDIKDLEQKKNSILGQHFVKQYYSIKVDDKENITKLIQDINKIIDMLSFQNKS